METTTMSCQDSAGSAWCHCCSTCTDLGGGEEDFLGLFGDRHSSSDDLFELVWRGAGGGGARGGCCGMEEQPSRNPLSSSRQRPFAVAPVPERPLAVAVAPAPPPPAPPSEAEMASWLLPIVCGGDAAVVTVTDRGTWVDDDQMVPSSGKQQSPDRKLQEKRKTSSTTGGRRSHHHAGAHSLTEKRRRWRINEKFKTLQQLVPGCDNSNQASTLDQTIRYMKSLQQHIQAMSSFRCRMKPTPVAAYPVVVQQAPCWQGGTSVQQG